MLKKLFISKVRMSILEQYLFDMKSAFHVRGLVRLLDEEINAVRRELLNLKSAGILKVRAEGNKLVYTLNKECPIIWELRDMMFKDSKEGSLMLEKFSKLDGLMVVILTDVYLTGKHHEDSDVDMLFIGNMKIKELNTLMTELEKELGKQIRYSALKPEDYEFARKRKEDFLINVLERDKIFLVGKATDLL